MSRLIVKARRIWDVLEEHEVPAAALMIGGFSAIYLTFRLIPWS